MDGYRRGQKGDTQTTMSSTTRGIIGPVVLLLLTGGCSIFSGKPKAPFDIMKDSSMVAYRLDPYEAPAATPGVAATTPSQIPGLPAQLQQLLSQGAQGLDQIIPPGLIPPGLLGQGGAVPGLPATAADTTPRFPDQQPNYRIISQVQVMDPSLRQELAKVLGYKSHFVTEHATCMLPELGIRWGMPPALPNDVLISFSCSQVAARGFIWPHPAVGMKPSTVEDLSRVVNKIFPAGT